MSLERSQVRRSQRQRYAASLVRKMANRYYEIFFLKVLFAGLGSLDKTLSPVTRLRKGQRALAIICEPWKSKG